MSDTLCVLPWIHVSTSTDGTFRPCCLSKTKIEEDTVEEAIQSEEMQILRESFLNGERPEECKTCWDAEDGGVESKRQNDNRRFGESLNKIVSSDPLPIKYIDLQMSNTCNLMCTICSPTQSSKIASEWNQAGIGSGWSCERKRIWVEDSAFWETLADQTRTATSVDFAGGEPLLIKQHTAYIKALSDHPNAKLINLHYNTNGTIVPDRDVFGAWSKFGYVGIMISMDGLYNQFEYLRYGAKWAEVMKTIDVFRKDYIHLELCHTISTYTIYYLPEFIRWADSMQLDVYLNVLPAPIEFRIDTLSSDSKYMIAERLTAFAESYEFRSDKTKSRITSFVDMMMVENDDLSADRRQKISDMDVRRGNSFGYTFPEMSNLI